MSSAVEQPKPKDAICPHCRREPCTLSAQMIMMGGMPWARVICSDCRKIISVNLLPPPPQPVQAAHEATQPQSKLWIPN